MNDIALDKGVKQISSFDFAQGIANILRQVRDGQQFEIVVRREVRARIEPFLPQSTDEAWRRVGTTELQKTFRSLDQPVVVLYYNEPAAIYTPIRPFGGIVRHPLIPLDSLGRDSDPYSWAVMTIRGVLQAAYERSGGMSEGEVAILAEIAKVMAEEDPYWLNHSMERLIGEAKAAESLFRQSIR